MCGAARMRSTWALVTTSCEQVSASESGGRSNRGICLAYLGLRLRLHSPAQEGAPRDPTTPRCRPRRRLFGSPDVIAIVAGRDIAEMDAVIDRIAEVRLVAATDSKVARWIDGIELPLSSTRRSRAPLARRRRA